jgi:hypothetical protein
MLQDIIVLGLAVGTAATTLTQSKIFRWLQTGTERVHPLVNDLFNCAYCMGHWVAAAAVFLWHPVNSTPVELLALWLATTGVAALTSGMIGKLFSEGE